MSGGKTKYIFTINALSHCDWKDSLEQLAEKVRGRKVLMVAEDGNVDPNAVRVHYQGSVVGYVCRDDAPMVRSMIVKSGKSSRLAVVEGVMTKPCYKLTGCCEWVDVTDLSIDDRLNQQYDQWQYSGPLLPPAYWQKELEGAVEYLCYVIAGELPWDDEAASYFQSFLDYHRMDFSDEMFHFRHQLMKYLEGFPAFGGEREQLELEIHEMSRHEYFEGIGHYVLSLPVTPEFQSMMSRQGSIDVALLVKQMTAFPENLTTLLMKDSKLFCKRLYYIHPHRAVLHRFFSGISLLLFMKSNGVLQNLQVPQSAALNVQNLLSMSPLVNGCADISIGAAQDIISDGGTKNVRNINGEKMNSKLWE